MAFPVDCTLGQDCYIQQYMDRDEGPGVSDYRCRGLSYDGHKGTDFALPTLEAMHEGVNVLAAADGRVRGFRDGMADRLYSDETAAEIEGRECGNGVVLV
ncbi:MAG: M23 family peptidase, partial [Pseudomonadota bacterium]